MASINIDPEYIELWNDFKKRINNKIPPSPTSKIAIECQDAVKKYIQNKGFPSNWIEPICKEILYEVMDLPLENGIELVVGSKVITRQEYEQFNTNRIDPNETFGERKISIVITSKMSVDHIIQFIRDYQDLILKYQDILGLPDFFNSSGKLFIRALRIIELKDEEGLTFAQIATKISQDEWLTEKEVDYFANESNIKTLYYEYKKHLRLK
ncbi:hypothetical protein HY469_03430 [Candidatus Roizmanbacteria bacterium]|nr:hypothetical protein [Candidatus Roizmanbacteria bacterium]